VIDFTYRSYVALLRHIRALGRAICPFREIPPDGSYVILRHDVDYSVVKALEMAEVEHAEGVRSTWFVLLTSPYYSLLAEDQFRALKQIAALGHEIGLHYDCDAFVEMAPAAQVDAVTRLARFLEEYAGTRITSIAQHNPSVNPLRLAVPAFLDVYGERFFKEIAYLSDSRRLWGAPDVYEFFRAHERSQLLIHPLWWHREPMSRRQSFDAIRRAIDTDVGARLDAMNASMERDEQALRRAAGERT
jgi:peptidoglycan/xylan/chitin deacetylase (PgdA/CDA1 family)